MAARGDNTTPSRADDNDDTPFATRPRAPTRAKFGRRTAAHWRFPYLRNLPPSRPARARAFGSGPACAQPRSVTGEAWTWRCSDPTPATAMPPPSPRPARSAHARARCTAGSSTRASTRPALRCRRGHRRAGGSREAGTRADGGGDGRGAVGPTPSGRDAAAQRGREALRRRTGARTMKDAQADRDAAGERTGRPTDGRLHATRDGGRTADGRADGGRACGRADGRAREIRKGSPHWLYFLCEGDAGLCGLIDGHGRTRQQPPRGRAEH